MIRSSNIKVIDRQTDFIRQFAHNELASFCNGLVESEGNSIARKSSVCVQQSATETLFIVWIFWVSLFLIFFLSKSISLYAYST